MSASSSCFFSTNFLSPTTLATLLFPGNGVCIICRFSMLLFFYNLSFHVFISGLLPIPGSVQMHGLFNNLVDLKALVVQHFHPPALQLWFLDKSFMKVTPPIT